VLDATTTEESSHTGVNILVQVETLLSLGHTTTSAHEDTVEEIGVTIMELTTDLSQSTSEESTECLFLSGSDVTEDTDVLRENVFTGTENGDGAEVGRRKARSVGGNVVGGHLLELSKDRTNLEALLEVVVLVSVDELDVLATVEDDGVVLVVRLAVTENGVAGKHDTELGTTHAVLHDLGVTVDEGRVDSRVLAFSNRRLLVKVGNLEVRVGAEKELGVLTLLLGELGVTLHGNTDLELATSHAFELTLKLVRVATEHLNDLGVLNTVEEFDGAAVIHETRDGTVKSLGAEGGPDTGAESVLRSGRLETNAVEGQVINLALGSVLLALVVVAVELRSLVGQNLGVLDEAVPLVRVKLLEVLQHGDTGVRLVFADDLTERQKDLLAVVRNQDSESGHVVNGQRLRDRCGKRLSEEGDTALGLGVHGEELSLKGVIFLRHEESRGTKSALAFLL
jgi:hypothetical protein